MKTRIAVCRLGIVAGLLLVLAAAHAQVVPASGQNTVPFALAELGAKAGAQYQGDGLSVLPAPEGARLHCVLQKLEGLATTEGLWLTSTARGANSDRFRVVASSVGREDSAGDEVTSPFSIPDFRFLPSGIKSEPSHVGSCNLPDTGNVAVTDKLARFARSGLIEEYSVSMDGVRQDFLVLQPPVGEGKLRVELDVTGARAEARADGARLVLNGSGRKLAYSRLRATDAQGHELPARMDVSDGRDAFHRVPFVPGGDQGRGGTRPCLAVVVDDATATYPVRIDPTFSDANWSAMGSGMDALVDVLAVSGSDLYAGGYFTTAGGIPANNIAKWNGSSWSALGSGMNAAVYALAVSGSDLYVGGAFTNAGGNAANYIAKWNGSSWSALGSGMNSGVGAIAVSGSNVYAAGDFTRAGGKPANLIAKWNGSSWSAMGSGMSPHYVGSLAVSGNTLYAGGWFTTAGGIAANNIAKWNGSSWSALGSGINAYVLVLAVSGSNVFAGGLFTTAGGSPATNIAKWNGSSWSALGSGAGPYNVNALAVSGSDVYLGGEIRSAGGSDANYIAKWNGSSWSPLGSGMNAFVYALAVSGSDLYAGGDFTTAGGKDAQFIAGAYLVPPTLSILPSGGDLKLSWPASLGGFVLQQNPDVANTNGWFDSNFPLATNGATISATIPITGPRQYFRLKSN